MDLLAIALTVFAALGAGVSSFRIRVFLLRALLVLAVTYAASYVLTSLSVAFGTDDQRSSWAPLLRDVGFYLGAVVGLIAATISHLIGSARRRRGAS